MNKKTIYTILASTIFLSALHFFLACVYHYTTTPSAVSWLFDLSSWSYPYKKDVVSINLCIVFVGVAASVIGNIQRIQEKTTGR
jgi:hypothetical protein